MPSIRLLPMQLTADLENVVCDLASDQARQAIELDSYWPKWDTPWWQMLLLHEMGETARIPPQTVRWFVESLKRYPLKIFPIKPEDMPAGLDPYRHTLCHCHVGNVFQVLTACGIKVDEELPWLRAWILRYQMEDGGFNCDNGAYLVKHECPSSMVGTISAFEAILLCTPRPFTAEENVLLKKAAHFVMKRKAMYGSDTAHNASEREEAKEWLKPCFPRFYFYDVLRGLNVLTLWAEKCGNTIPPDSIREAVAYLKEHFPDGLIRNERHCYGGSGTIVSITKNEWKWQETANFFPLLEKVSVVGEISPFLSNQWKQIQARIY